MRFKITFVIFVTFSFLYSSGAEFLLIYPDARGSAMGGALFSLAEGEEGVFWNPAGIPEKRDPHISGTHSEWFQGARFEYVAFSLPKNRFGYFGIGMKALYILNIERRTQYTIQPEGTYSAIFSNLNFSYSKKISEYFNFGITLKVIYENIYKDMAFAFAGDMGLLYLSPAGIRAGLVVKNIGTPVKFINESDPLPLSINAGISYLTPSRNLAFSFGYSYDVPDKWGGVNIGAEYTILNKVYLRAGYTSLLNNIDGFSGYSFGAGFKILGYKIDYSFVPYGILGFTHKITISYSFGYSRKKRLELVKKLKAKTRAELLEKEKLTSMSYYEQGKEKFGKGEYEEAQKLLDIALIWDPDNQKAKELLALTQGKLLARKLTKLFNQARRAFRKGNMPEALKSVSEILKLDPANEDAKILKDSIDYIIKEQAKKRAEKVKRKEEVSTYFEKGIKYFEKGNYKKAKIYFEKVLKIFPGHKEAKEYITKTKYEIENKFNECYEKANKYYKEKKYNESYLFIKKALEYKSTPEAKNMFENIKRKIKEEVDKLIKEAKELYSKGKYDESYEICLRAKKFSPDNPEILSLIRKIERERGEEIDLDKLYLLGIQAYTRDDYRTALSYWGKILEIDPNYPNARKNYERALAKIKELEKK